MADLVKVSQGKIEKSWVNWIEFHYGIDCDETTERWCKCVDPGNKNAASIDPWNGDDGFTKVFPDIATRINLMAGPHYHAFIKAWYVNNPWK